MDFIFAIGWEGLIIPLIAFGIFAFSSLFGEKKGAIGNKVTPLGPGNKNPVSDIERFFEEARNRRVKQVPKAGIAPLQQTSRPSKPAAVPFKQQPPKKIPVNKNLHPGEPLGSKESGFSHGVGSFIPTGIAGALAKEGEPQIFLGDLDVTPKTISGGVGHIFSSKTSPLIAEALALLKGPKVLGSAFVIQEILSLPLCLRPRQIR